MLSFHGRGDNIQNFQFTNMHLAWPEAIVVYFQGLPTRGGLSSAGRPRRARMTTATCGSSTSHWRHSRDRFKVDEARIYSTGFSNGAGFTCSCGPSGPSVFAAFAPVAGRLRPSVQPREAKPVFHVAGTADETVPFCKPARGDRPGQACGRGPLARATACGKGCTTYRSPGGPR